MRNDGRLTLSVQLMLGHNATVLDRSATDNSISGCDKGKCVIISEPRAYHKMLPNSIAAQPTTEYFLAIICDLKIDPKMRRRFGIRYTDTPEVQKLLTKLKRKQNVRSELAKIDANVIIAALKEILNIIPGGIFDDQSEEFLSVSLGSSLQTALLYVNNLILQLPYSLRQFTYLICRSLKNLIQQSVGSTTDAYTGDDKLNESEEKNAKKFFLILKHKCYPAKALLDALLLFTPPLFPNSVREVSRFLRAARISLILIDLCDVVFRPFFPLTNAIEEDFFFHDILDSLTYLCNWLNSDVVNNGIVEDTDSNDDDDDYVDVGKHDDYDNDYDGNYGSNSDVSYSLKKLPDATHYYQITYLVD
ncbi:unnamed protein product [Litomosoides sigmodontis]|uniref:Uncharacterized protein n=1 Tax=Litomosoides sigmodontis TaxID=42156 RepID=A0A3P6TRA0_LITSI|nr:unnamed protein product [Litomosoides sigmodontis]